MLEIGVEGRERVIAFESLQLKAAERNYFVHDKLLCICSSQIQNSSFWLQAFSGLYRSGIFTHRDSITSPLAEDGLLPFIFYRIQLRGEKQSGGKCLDDALSSRPDYELAHFTILSPSVTDSTRASNAKNDQCVALIRALKSDEFKDSKIKLSAQSSAGLNR